MAPTPTQVATRIPTVIPDPTPYKPSPLPRIDPNVIPHIFVGSVLVSGSPARDGMKVTVWLYEYGSPVASDEVADGKYSLMVNQYGNDSFSGKTLVFKIDGVTSHVTDETLLRWEKGGATVLNLLID